MKGTNDIITISLCLVALAVIADSTFSGVASCSDSSSCRIICSSATYDFTGIVTSDGGSTQRYLATDVGQYSYGLIIPLCGNYPAESDDIDWTTEPSFYISHIWQFNNNINRHGVSEDYYLGDYVSGSWVVGSYNGAVAFSISYWNGQSCAAVTGRKRSTTVYISCNSAYTISAPKITVSEPTTCIYEILIETREVCYLSTSPTALPTLRPTALPTSPFPTAPTVQPSVKPSAVPTLVPTVLPTRSPSMKPTTPTVSPTVGPSLRPTITPSAKPSAPTFGPTIQATAAPSVRPSLRPTQLPTATPSAPTVEPTQSPTNSPTVIPTRKPSLLPTTQPTSPTAQPSVSALPTQAPSFSPSAVPTVITIRPTMEPTTAVPSSAPTVSRQLESHRRQCTVTSPTSCTLSCSSSNGGVSTLYDFSSTLTVLSTGVQRYYQLAASSSVTYAVVIPMCGTRPSALNGMYASSDVWKIATGSFSSIAGKFPLGKYQNNSWEMVSLNGIPAFSLNFTSTSVCSGTTRYSSSVFLVCNGNYSSSSPQIAFLQESTCAYAVTMQSAAYCPSALLVNTTTTVPNSSGGSAQSNGLDSTGATWLSVGLVGSLVFFGISYLAYRKRQKTLSQVYVDIQLRYGHSGSSNGSSSGGLPVFISAPQRLITSARERVADITARYREPVEAEAVYLEQPAVEIVDVPTADVRIVPATPRQMVSLGSGSSRDTMAMTEMAVDEGKVVDEEDEAGEELRLRSDSRRKKSSRKSSVSGGGGQSQTVGRRPTERSSDVNRNISSSSNNACSSGPVRTSSSAGGVGGDRPRSTTSGTVAAASGSQMANGASAKTRKKPVKGPPRVIEFNLHAEQNV